MEQVTEYHSPAHQKGRDSLAWGNIPADKLTPEVATQKSILVIGLQDTPTGKWDWIKGWLHLKYME